MKVADMSAAAVRLYERLPDNPAGIPVKVGWDGERIAAFSGTYKAPVKSLPHQALTIEPWRCPEEIEAALLDAVAKVRRDIAPLMRGGRPVARAKKPSERHHWRKG